MLRLFKTVQNSINTFKISSSGTVSHLTDTIVLLAHLKSKQYVYVDILVIETFRPYMVNLEPYYI